jgi:hypothetical protein
MTVACGKALHKAEQQLRKLVSSVERAVKEGTRIDLLERDMMHELLAIGHTLLEGFVAAQGNGDAGAELPADDGRTVVRLERPRPRRYLSIFGELTIKRFVYAAREGQKIQRAPVDERLGLPAGEFSYVLEDWLGRLCVKESFQEATCDLRQLLGLSPSVRAAEHMSQRIAADVEAFEIGRPAPPAGEEGKIVVATADGKGVPMRRPLAERARRGPRRTKGANRNKKQMAYVGAVYTIDPFPRTADEVIDEVARKARARERPVPRHKHVWAEMTRVSQGEGGESSGRDRLFIEMAIAAHDRDPTRKKTLVCLMDGEAALWKAQQEWLPGAVCILDLFHVLERLWSVAHVFHREGSREAEAFVTRHLRMLLEGKVGYVIGRFKRLRDAHAVRGPRRAAVTAAIGYYENNRAHMRYDAYLAAGYPIGSGVAEGACRHVVKDRMEQTGMRWTLEGAQALLHLRAVYLNGQWNAFLDHHIETEQSSQYGRFAA